MLGRTGVCKATPWRLGGAGGPEAGEGGGISEVPRLLEGGGGQADVGSFKTHPPPPLYNQLPAFPSLS